MKSCRVLFVKKLCGGECEKNVFRQKKIRKFFLNHLYNCTFASN